MPHYATKVLSSFLIAIALTSCNTTEQPADDVPVDSQSPTSDEVDSDAPTQADNPSTDSWQATVRPNVWFEVKSESGTCPETVGLWEFLLGFEGGADHTVVPDITPITTLPIEVRRPEEQRIVYEAPLQAAFADCVGTARSETLSMYSFELDQGQLRFQVDLTNAQGFREIRYADTSANRPYVHWRVTE